MPTLIKTERKSWGVTVHIYACDICGREIEYYHDRPNQAKICYFCRKEKDRARAKARAEEHDQEVRNEVIDKILANAYESKSGFLTIRKGFLEGLKTNN